MAKKNHKLVKNITVDGLAKIINDGFNGQMGYLKEQFGHVEKRFDQVDKRLTSVETKMGSVDERLEKVETVLTEAHVL